MASKVGSSVLLAVVLVALLAGGATGQTGPAVPDLNKITILIRTTVIAIDHANRTGNYTVLRDLGSPAFREANTAARLAEIFGNLRKKNLDFGPIVLFPPRLTRQPAIDQRGMLRLTGFFPTRPLNVNFDLAYELIEGRWRLFGVSISATPAKQSGKGG
ncbi:MAG: hypothetical protein ACE5JZ_09820 [Kiloniellales bacterium]